VDYFRAIGEPILLVLLFFAEFVLVPGIIFVIFCWLVAETIKTIGHFLLNGLSY
jgi:hypothetical protein